MGEPSGGSPPREASSVASGEHSALLAASAYRAIFDHSPEPHFLETLDGMIVDVNQAAADLHGWTREELVGKPFQVTLADADPEVIEAAGRDLREQGWFRSRVTGRRRDGTTLPLEVVGARMAAREGELVLVHAIDLSVRTALEDATFELGELARLGERPLDPGAVARRAVEIAVGSFGAASGALVTFEGGRVQWHAVVGTLPAPEVFERHNLPDSSSVLRQVLATRLAVEVDLAPTEGRLAATTDLRKAGFTTAWILPVQSGDEHRGVIALLFGAPPAPGAFDADRLGSIGRIVGTAMHNAWLREEMRVEFERRASLASRLETLVDLTRLRADPGDDRALARSLLGRVTSALGADGALIVETADGRLHPLASIGLTAQEEGSLAGRPATDWGVYRRLTASEPAFVAAVGADDTDDEWPPGSRPEGIHTCAAFPIRADEQVDGILVTLFRRPVESLEIDEETVEAIGRIVAIAFANQRLRRIAISSERRYWTLFQESPDALMLLDRDGRVVDANEAAMHLYGASAGWLIGRDVRDLTAGERPALQGDETGFRVWRAAGQRADGTTFPQEAILSPVELDGEPRDLVRIRDLTEQEQLQQELVQAQKMEAIGQLVSGVAHELNNPLAAIMAFSQLLREDARLPADMRRDADLLVGEADRTRRIVQNLLDFARQRPPERHPTSLRALVDSVIELQSYTLNSGQIQVSVEIPAEIPRLLLDRAQMQQVLLNLTLNAIQAIGQASGPGTIRIEAGTVADGSGRSVRLTVTDNGPGVRLQDRDRLFIPFFTTKEPGEGTGLGLPVSFGIVAAHGGQLTYEPGPGGRGSTFVITLPLGAAWTPGEAGDAPRETRKRPPREVDGAGRSGRPEHPARPRVLVLDDEPSIRTFLAKVLTGAGFEPIATGDGDDALRLVREGSFQAVLCDHRMAGMSGIQVFEAMVAIRPDLAGRFVLMSGDVLNQDLAAFASRHQVTLLAKPFDIDTVARTVRELVRRNSGDAQEPAAGSERKPASGQRRG